MLFISKNPFFKQTFLLILPLLSLFSVMSCVIGFKPFQKLNILSLLSSDAGCLTANVIKGDSSKAMDPDANRNTVQLIESRGFKAETHYVQTADGYILTIHRIRNPFIKQVKKNRVVVLQHGFVSSSRDFVVNSPGEDVTKSDTKDICDPGAKERKVGNNLGFVLSKLGFDVWLGNSRGTTYSLNHTKYSIGDPEFWKFTFDDIAKYDLPAYIQHILTITREKTLSYIGYSEGGFAGLALMSLQPEYANIIKPYIGMAPAYAKLATKMSYGTLQLIPYLTGDILGNLSGPLFPVWTNALLVHLCRGRKAALCANMVASWTGCNSKQTNVSRYHVYFNNMPSQSSIWNFNHYLQAMRSNEMSFYDYGAEENLKKYGKVEPPKYDFGQIKSKYVAILHGENDYMATQESMKLLQKALKIKLLDDYLVPDTQWTHADFLYGKDLGKLALGRIVQILQRVLCLSGRNLVLSKWNRMFWASL